MKDRTPEKKDYIFTIHKGEVSLAYGIMDKLMVECKVEDVELLSLPSQFTIISFEDRILTPNGDIFEEHLLRNIKYEGQFFIRLFRIMKDRAFFTVISDKKYYDCYYIDGKLFYIEETPKEYKVMGTDFHKLHLSLENYQILVVNPLSSRYDYATFMDEHDRVANTLGKEFRKYKDGQLITKVPS